MLRGEMNRLPCSEAHIFLKVANEKLFIDRASSLRYSVSSGIFDGSEDRLAGAMRDIVTMQSTAIRYLDFILFSSVF
jgi:hypothetical protein